MMSPRFALLAAFTTILAIAQCLAASPAPSTDPLAAIDLNRNSIIADIVRSFESQVGVENPSAAKLKARLEKLRADKLLAASLASSRETLDAIIAEAEAPRSAAFTQVREKALGDPNKDLLYTPLAPCRLIDTRGNGAPFQGGAFVPGERRAYVPAGACSIPASGVATMLISFTTQNLTPVSGGVLAILAPGAPFTATVDVFNLGSTWSASNTAVATGSAGQFDVYVLIANAHVVVDVLGYFTPMQANITLAQSTATTGNILKEANPFIHNFGGFNTFVGENAGNFTMTGQQNTAIGGNALRKNTTGSTNTASGNNALPNNTTGRDNTATGSWALVTNTSGSNNTASGSGALYWNNGSYNTASGYYALGSNLSGLNNTAAGASALASNLSGSGNTAIGQNALGGNTNGPDNTASGREALASNTTGFENTANGGRALANNTTGFSNIALGYAAGFNLTTGSYNISIGNGGVAGEASTIRIGNLQTNTFIAGIRGVTTNSNDAIPVLVDSNGQLGTASSSRRFKEDIADMDSTSSALMKLRPVTFHYKTDNRQSGRTLQYGLVAEEVAEVYPGLVAHSADGQIETVMYQFLPPMLLNEYQKQQRTIEAQEKLIARLAEERHVHTAEIAGLKQAMARMATAVDQLQRASAVTAALLK